MIDEDINLSPKKIFFWIVIIAIFVLLFVFSEFDKVHIQNDQLMQNLATQGEKINSLQQEVNSLRVESTGEVSEIKKKLAQQEMIGKALGDQKNNQNQKINLLETKISETSSEVSLSDVINQWRPVVAYIECNFQMQNGFMSYKSDGSGIALKFDGLPVSILTNRHVVVPNNLYELTSCDVKLPDNNLKYNISADDISVSSSEYDWAIMSVLNPDTQLSELTGNTPKICAQKPSLGDSVIVLGYPGIGSKNSVTATEGIISGFDGDYFITSAKVEQGNSGGAAILSKDNCLLGIPTFASLGQVESLARILDIWTIVIKK